MKISKSKVILEISKFSSEFQISFKLILYLCDKILN